MKRTCLAVAILLLSGSTLAAKDKLDTRVSVYVFTAADPSGFVNAETAVRVKDVATLQKLIAKRSKTLRVSETREDARLVLEVTGLSMVTKADGLGALVNTLNSLSGGLQALRPKEKEENQVEVRHVTLSLQEYTTDVEGQGPYYLMKAIERWVKTNQAQLTATSAKAVTVP